LQEGLQKGLQKRNLEILKLFESGYSAEQIKEQLKGDGSVSAQ
jgi:DNA-binding CsgD family transcriptional regulator